MKLFIPILIFLQILFSQCDSLPYGESEYYYYPYLDIDHVGSTLDCYYINDWDILDDLITINNLEDLLVGELGYQNWNDNGRLKNFTLNYSFSTSPQYIDQRVNTLPENFGELEMLESLEMYYHNLTVFPISFPQLENLKALNMKGNRLKILNANFGSLSSLEVLDLGYNDLVALPESISGLINMNYFWIFGNDISYIPDSVCELDIDWSGESGDFIYFGSGGNHLCGDVPTCVESSLFFNIMLEEQGYAFQIESDQVCACTDGSYPDCMELCPNDENYGSIIDACGLCTSPEEVCNSDCTGSWGGSASIDECGICDGDGSACEDVGTLSLDFDQGINTYVIYETPENDNWEIGGFQFDVEGTGVFSQSGGAAAEMGFNVTISGQLILGFSFTGAVISAGIDTLLILHSEDAITGLTNITISDAISQPAQSLNFVFDDGNLEICDSEYDCSGECGGSAGIDECGICNGFGTTTWYLDSDGDGLGASQSSSNFCYEPDGYASNSDDSDDSVFCPYQYLDDNFNCFGDCADAVDCAGICGGSLIEDDCGECGGDNSYCTGCMDDTACNYSLTAIISGECEYAVEDYDCSGNCNVEVDCDGVCGGSAALDDCSVCDGDGTSCLSIDNHIPESFSINNIYPNPFNPVVNIEYSLANSELVNISIYDLNGQIVNQLFSGHQSVGNHHTSWHASEMSSGIYIITIQSGNIILSDQIILLK